MKSKLTIFVLIGLIILPLFSFSSTYAKPLSQTISIQGDLTGPDAQGKYNIEGTFTATGYPAASPRCWENFQTWKF